MFFQYFLVVSFCICLWIIIYIYMYYASSLVTVVHKANILTK
jgi:hypothetical protein